MMNQTVHSPRASGGPARRGRPPAAVRDAEATRDEILQAAMSEFADHGLAGARIDAIAAATRSSKRMIYYYFGSKEGLYVAALERGYAGIREAEAALELDGLAPEDALRRLVGATVDHHLAHPDYIRLVMGENLLRGQYLARSEVIGKMNVPAIDAVRDVYRRGVEQGVFRAGVDPVDLHMSISALAVFNVANRYTFGQIFRLDLDAPKAIVARRDSIIDMVLRFVRR